MKNIILALMLASLVVGCSSSSQVKFSQESAGDQWITVTGRDGSVLAAVNKKNGQVRYYDNPEKAFVAAFEAYAKLEERLTQLAQQAQQAQQQKPTAASAPAVAKKKP